MTTRRTAELPLLVRAFLFLLLLPFILLVSPILLLIGLYALALHIAIWLVWLSKGRDVLFVHSNSPVWSEYMQDLLTRMGDRAVVLNWSERKNWPSLSLATMTFRWFGGYRNYNPMVVVFRPLRSGRCFRYWRAFKDHKHGKPEAVEQLTRDLFALLETR